MRMRCAASTLMAVLFASSVSAQTNRTDATIELIQQMRVVANAVYLKANGWQGRLDVYAWRDAPPTPVVVFIHGGGWVQGTKEGSVLSILPYAAMGFAVVNVEYRLAETSPAPAAVEDCRCALRWVVDHAKQYNIDPDRIVVAGASAGGHLALTTAMLPVDAGFDRECFTTLVPRVKAIVNFFGITDVADLLEGPGRKPFPDDWPYAVQWLGNAPDREALARRVSPMTYVRPGVPPTISIHGDQDPLVPYNHSVRLHEALKKAGVPNELVTIAGGKHGGFTLEENRRIYTAIQRFLTDQHVLAAKPSSQQ